jgi:hypothetical protein
MQSPWLVSLQALFPLVAGWGPFSGMVEPPVEGVCVPSDPMTVFYLHSAQAHTSTQ